MNYQNVNGSWRLIVLLNDLPHCPGDVDPTLQRHIVCIRAALCEAVHLREECVVGSCLHSNYEKTSFEL